MPVSFQLAGTGNNTSDRKQAVDFLFQESGTGSSGRRNVQSIWYQESGTAADVNNRKLVWNRPSSGWSDLLICPYNNFISRVDGTWQFVRYDPNWPNYSISLYAPTFQIWFNPPVPQYNDAILRFYYSDLNTDWNDKLYLEHIAPGPMDFLGIGHPGFSEKPQGVECKLTIAAKIVNTACWSLVKWTGQVNFPDPSFTLS